MMILTRIVLAITLTLTVVHAGTLTPVPKVTVTNFRCLTTSLTIVTATLHDTPTTHPPVVVHAAVIGHHVPLPAIITMILLRGSLAEVVQSEVTPLLPL